METPRSGARAVQVPGNTWKTQHPSGKTGVLLLSEQLFTPKSEGVVAMDMVMLQNEAAFTT